MSSDEFAISDSSGSWNYDEVIRPPKWVLLAGIISVAVGALWSIACVLDVQGLVEFEAIEPKFFAGFIGYVLTLWVPLFLIVFMRRFQMKHAKENPGGYDSYAGLVMANRLKYLAIIGLAFSFVAIYVAVLPIAETWA